MFVPGGQACHICVESRHALLRCTGAAVRFAIKAVRRAPRVQGISTSVVCAVLTMDLIKRVFIAAIL